MHTDPLAALKAKLDAALQSLSDSADLVDSNSVEPVSGNLRLLGEAIAQVIKVQMHLSELRPDLRPPQTTQDVDPPLTDEQQTRVLHLSTEDVNEIDQVLLSSCIVRWRKVAMIVGIAMTNFGSKFHGVPDLYYAQRVAALVSAGQLEAEGDLRKMGASEVRLPTR